MGRVAFVSPRYGRDFVGGAEALVREAALGLAGRGWDVEVVTTCVRNHYTWRNELPPGIEHEEMVTIRRFPVVHPVTSVTRHRLEHRILAGERLAADEQRLWLNSVYRAPDLFHHLVGHADGYDAMVFAPYLAWASAVGIAVAPERSFVMPCLHDEPFARLDLFTAELEDVAGVWFLSEPEHELAHTLASLPEHHRVTGGGVIPPSPDAYDAARFRQKFGVRKPFVLFAGRREDGKGWPTLVHQLARIAARAPLPLDLVTLGAGTITVPPALADHVVDLGFVSDADRNDAFAAATAYVQPSPNESFSRTTMEAWLAGTPVVATARGAVVAWHCLRSQGGLVYDDEYDLAEALALLAESSETAAALGAAGREYVLEHYSWPIVLEVMEQSLREVAR